MTTTQRTTRYLLATVFSALVGLAVLPLSTRVLGPTDYGAFAFANAAVAIGVSLATLGSSYVVNNRVANALPQEARSYLGAATVIGSVTAAATSVLLVIGYLALRDSVDIVGSIPALGLAFGLAPLLLAPVWSLTSDLLTLEGRATTFMTLSIAQAVITAGSLLLALFVLDLGRAALFIANGSGYAALGIGAFLALRGRVTLKPSRQFLRDHARTARGYFLAQSGETAGNMAERTLLGQVAGLDQLGLYSHAARYRDYAFFGTKSLSRGVWPVSLAEARDLHGSFPLTQVVWPVIQIGLAIAGTTFALIGDWLIGLLTNGKFAAAAPYASAWFIVAIVQQSTKAEQAVVYALGQPADSARPQTLANFIWLGSLPGLVLLLGTWGALGAVFGHQVTLRAAYRRRALRIRPVRFGDFWAVLGILVVVSGLVAKAYIQPDLGQSLAMLAVGSASLLVAGWKPLSRFLAAAPLPRLGLPRWALGLLRTASSPELVAGDLPADANSTEEQG